MTCPCGCGAFPHWCHGCGQPENPDGAYRICGECGHVSAGRHGPRHGWRRVRLRPALTPYMRFVVQYAAYHKGVYVRDTALAGSPNPLHDGGSVSYQHALRHMRNAAVTGQRRDDRWTRWRTGAANAAKAAARIEEERV